MSSSDPAPLILLVGRALPIPAAERALRAAGCEAYMCVDTLEAALLALAGRRRPAVVIVDGGLAGGINGHGLGTTRRRDGISIIALSPGSERFETELHAELMHIFGGQVVSEAA